MPVDGGADFRHDALFLGHRTGIKTSLTTGESCGYGVITIHRSLRATLRRSSRSGLKGYETSAVCAIIGGQQRRAALARLRVSKGCCGWDETSTAIDKQGVEL